MHECRACRANCSNQSATPSGRAICYGRSPPRAATWDGSLNAGKAAGEALAIARSWRRLVRRRQRKQHPQLQRCGYRRSPRRLPINRSPRFEAAGYVERQGVAFQQPGVICASLGQSSSRPPARLRRPLRSIAAPAATWVGTQSASRAVVELEMGHLAAAREFVPASMSQGAENPSDAAFTIHPSWLACLRGRGSVGGGVASRRARGNGSCARTRTTCSNSWSCRSSRGDSSRRRQSPRSVDGFPSGDAAARVNGTRDATWPLVARQHLVGEHSQALSANGEAGGCARRRSLWRTGCMIEAHRRT